MAINVRSNEEFIADPTGHMIAVVDDRARAAELEGRLEGAGFEEVRLYVGHDGEHAIDPKGEEHGITEQAVRTVQQALTNKDNLAEYAQAIEDGAGVVAFLAADDRQGEALALLESYNAHTINFFGAAVVHTLKP
ncbi:MAG: hypothetical protein DWI48_02160 [Chloroflexi bacterium]|nr:MAG: hypothetical protein DWI48_02160 [Chloroflexota bacterium]